MNRANIFMTNFVQYLQAWKAVEELLYDTYEKEFRVMD
jgi:hypothetical protein